MRDKVDAVDRVATKLGVRPLAARIYWLWRDVTEAVRDIKYRQYRLRNDTYPVRIGDAEAAMSVLTQQEYHDFVQLPERPILEELLSDLRLDDVFYDVGANLGLYACLVADLIGRGVVAFEPHPKNADRLARNAAVNESDISIHRVALADSSGTTQMTLSPGFDLDRLGSAGHTLLTEYYDAESDAIPVTKRRGDEFVESEDLPPPTILKIDTEGTELAVLEGFDSTLAHPACRRVSCEVHEERLAYQGHAVSDVCALLASHGFAVEERSIAGYQTFVCGRKPGL